jgi:hypothetical protein
MNEQAQSIVNQTLLSFLETATQAKDFLVSETPEVVHQLLQWKFFESLIHFSLGVIGLICLVVWLTYWTKFTKKRWNQMDFDDVLIILGVVGCGSLPWLPIAVKIFTDWEWIQILIAPKLYLLEYAASLVK